MSRRVHVNHNYTSYYSPQRAFFAMNVESKITPSYYNDLLSNVYS